MIQKVKVGDMITDHNLLLCTVNHPKPHLQEKKIVTRKLQSIDLPSFREDIVRRLRVNDLSESVMDLLNRYNGHLTSVLDKHAPKKERYVVVQGCTTSGKKWKEESWETVAKDWPHRSQRNLQSWEVQV